jgi:hypothetical protein
MMDDSYMQSKCAAQRKALHTLNLRVRIQRLQLRALNEMGRGLNADEWNALKAEHAAELDAETFDAFK